MEPEQHLEVPLLLHSSPPVFDGDPLDKNSPYRKDLPSPKHAIAIRKLSFVASISLVFLVLEVIGGVVSQSLAIFSDAAYRLSDLVIYLIGIVSIYLSRKPAGPQMTFGYSRAEVLGALLSVLIIWVIAFFLCAQAVRRILEPVDVNGLVMLIVSVFGLACNIIMGIILVQRESAEQAERKPWPPVVNLKLHPTPFEHTYNANGTDHVVNIKAALVNVIGDGLQSVGVIIASLIIYIEPSWTIADPICTFIFSAFVLFATVPICKDCIQILLEAAPAKHDVETIIKDLSQIPCVEDIHAVHLWSISGEKTVFSCHLRSTNPIEVTQKVSQIIKYKYGITYPTIQCEPMCSDSPQENDILSVQLFSDESHLHQVSTNQIALAVNG